MRVLVCVKHVPQDLAAYRLDATFATNRADLPGHLGAADRAALAVACSLGADEVVAVTMAPAGGELGLAQAAEAGATRLLHVEDSALVGSDVAATSLVLSAVARAVEADLVLCGAASDDGASGFVPAQVAARLDVPFLGGVATLTMTDDGLVGERGVDRVVAPLPAVASVLPRPDLPDPRPGAVGGVTVLRLRDLDVDPAHVGRPNAWTRVETVVPLVVAP